MPDEVQPSLSELQRRVGKKVLMRSQHPWSGVSGTIVGLVRLSLFPEEGPKPKIALDNGMETIAVHPADYTLIEE